MRFQGEKMTFVSGDNHYAGTRGIREGSKWGEPKRVVLIVSDAGTVSERLVDALVREFPWIVVEQVEHVRDACTNFSHSVALILLDLALMKDAQAASTLLARLHPRALTAVMEPHDRNLATPLEDVIGSSLVRGVLPMNLRLDVWLSVVRLMLCGGEYFPPDLVRNTGHASESTVVAADNADAHSSRTSDRPTFAELTPREMQILEMVARGMQNKLIAAEFRLSEHTVKIHLHHIISKLGARNRTEAAAKYRNFQECLARSSADDR
ncbi:response regulator transcription factor [Rhizobiaceae bacterium n13]|uniref:Response regulator transcription factor n=1 Tax=Ferirhizobium litorale TaxID=2927786 RepID=A0AAE3U0S5_9HYPH|nr:response regulator transcription factor [Fererhizobium litorale]MDI7860729.1 response regulator transcription factor [Fererhizobium litorale]MDI7920877.1 response regulator transcription factor [Fererhizobium litorale]